MPSPTEASSPACPPWTTRPQAPSRAAATDSASRHVLDRWRTPASGLAGFTTYGACTNIGRPDAARVSSSPWGTGAAQLRGADRFTCTTSAPRCCAPTHGCRRGTCDPMVIRRPTFRSCARATPPIRVWPRRSAPLGRSRRSTRRTRRGGRQTWRTTATSGRPRWWWPSCES